MPGRRARAASAVALVAGAWISGQAAAYGPDGHLIAGRAAAERLCAQAAQAVAEFGGGEDLGELGLWADRIRSNPDYANAAPWHYMNLADDASVADFEHPPEGDVLWAIAHFRARLADRSLGAEARGEALRFLVHFIVDLHQPLHVGREADRGGNSIGLRYRGEPTNLHRFWDTDAIDWTGLSHAAYIDRLSNGVWTPPLSAAQASVEDWARESFALREQVYSFGREGIEPPPAYLDAAADTTGRRLAYAAVRLAHTLNDIFCTD